MHTHVDKYSNFPFVRIEIFEIIYVSHFFETQHFCITSSFLSCIFLKKIAYSTLFKNKKAFEYID